MIGINRERGRYKYLFRLWKVRCWVLCNAFHVAENLVRFEDFELDPKLQELRRRGMQVPMEPRPYELLRYLVEHRDRVVPKEELLSRLWGDVVVGDASLSSAVREIRVALGDDARHPRFVETHWRRGYRFIARVEQDRGHSKGPKPAEVDTNDASKDTRRFGRWALWAAAAVGVLAVLTFEGTKRSSESPPEIRSIAVLPLQNLSGDTSQDYFAAGVTEDLIGALSRIRSLRVPSHRSVLRFDGTNEPLAEVAEQLGVDALIAGSVRREGPRVRITVQLVRGATDEHIWSENYDDDMESILDLQSGVARAIAQKVRVSLSEAESAALSRTRSVVPEAYDAYLLGRHEINRSAYWGAITAAGEFSRAVRIDPEFGAAHAWMSFASLNVRRDAPPIAQTADSEKLVAKAREAARAAIRLEEEVPIALLSQGLIQLTYDWNWRAAEESFRRAIEYDPRSSAGYWGLAQLYAALGAAKEARAAVRQGLELEPLFLAATLVGHRMAFATGKYAQGLAGVRSARKLAETAEIHRTLWRFYDVIGDYDRAIEAWQEGSLSGGIDPESALAAYRAGGYGAFIRFAADHEERRDRYEEVSPYWIAYLHARAGNVDRAFQYLEIAFDERAPDLVFIVNADPVMGSLRSDPRFARYAERLGIPIAAVDLPLAPLPR